VGEKRRGFWDVLEDDELEDLLNEGAGSKLILCKFGGFLEDELECI